MTNVSYNQNDSLVEILGGNGAVFDYMDGMQLVGNFGSPIGEYDSIRHDNTVSDRSQFGLLKVNGKDALELLNRLSTNKVVDLPSGQGASTILTNNKGRIIDRLLVSNLGDYSLVFTSPGRSAAVMDWIDTYTFGEDIAIQDIGCQKSIISITESKTPGLLDRSMYPVELYASTRTWRPRTSHNRCLCDWDYFSRRLHRIQPSSKEKNVRHRRTGRGK